MPKKETKEKNANTKKINSKKEAKENLNNTKKKQVSNKTLAKNNVKYTDINSKVYKNLLENEYSKGNFYAIPEGLYNKENPEDLKLLNTIKEYFLYQNPSSTIMFPEGLFESVRHLRYYVEIVKKDLSKLPSKLQKTKLKKLRAFEKMTEMVTHQKELPISKLAEKRIEKLENSRNRFEKENIYEFVDSYSKILDVNNFGKIDKTLYMHNPEIIYEKQQKKLVELVKILSKLGYLKELLDAQNKNIDVLNYYLGKIDVHMIPKLNEESILNQINNLNMQDNNDVAAMQVYSLTFLNKLIHDYEYYLDSMVYFSLVDDNEFSKTIENIDKKFNSEIEKYLDEYLNNNISEKEFLEILKQVKAIENPESYLIDLVEKSYKNVFDSNELITRIGEIEIKSEKINSMPEFNKYYIKMAELSLGITIIPKLENIETRKPLDKIVAIVASDKKRLINKMVKSKGITQESADELMKMEVSPFVNQVISMATASIKKGLKETLSKMDRCYYSDIRKYMSPTKTNVGISLAKLQFTKDCLDDIESFRKKYNRIRKSERQVSFEELIKVVSNAEYNLNDLKEDERNLLVEMREYLKTLRDTGLVSEYNFIEKASDILENNNRLKHCKKWLIEHLLTLDRRYVYFQNSTILGAQHLDIKRAGTINIIINNHAQIFGGHYLSSDFEFVDETVQNLDNIPYEAFNGFKSTTGLNLRVNCPMLKVDSLQNRAFRDLYIILDDIDNETTKHASINQLSIYNELRSFKLDHPREYQALKITCLLGCGTKYYRMYTQGRNYMESIETSINKDKKHLEELEKEHEDFKNNIEISLRNFSKNVLLENANNEGNMLLKNIKKM